MKRKHIHFGSTPNLHNLLPTISKNTDRQGRLAYAGYDPSLNEPPTEAQLALLKEYTPTLPTLTFSVIEKLHGENMAVCYHNGELWVQGRNQIRTLTDDQNGMAQFVESNKDSWLNLINLYAVTYSIDTVSNIICIDCEWAGGSIQKGNAACSGIEKSAFIFEYIRVVDYNDITDITLYKSHIRDSISPNIYFLEKFHNSTVTLDFNDIDSVVAKLASLVDDIESNSPIAKHFNLPDNVGEGAYLMHIPDTSTPTKLKDVYRLKAKGVKHGGKPKEPKSQKFTNAEQAKLSELANLVTPEWRLSQAIQETEATSMKDTGKVIAWVTQDIIKEEQPLLAKYGYSINDIKSYTAKISKDFFHRSLLN